MAERLNFNDRYIKGVVAFEDLGDKARLSYTNKGLPILPVNAQYQIAGKSWKVVRVKTSDYNSFVVNADLELING